MAKTKRPTARQLANPGERSKIPTAQLPAKYRAARLRVQAQAKTDQSALYQPGKELSGRNLRDTVNRVVEAQTRPQMDALEREGRNITTQGTALQSDAGSTYRKIAAREAANMARQKAIQDRVRANLSSVDKGNQDAVSASTQAAQASVAAPQGLQGSSTERLAAEGQALGARAAAQGASYRDLSEVQGGNYAGLQEAMASATQMHGGEIQERLANRMMNKTLDNEAKQQDIRSNRGNLAAKTAVDLRQQGFDNMVVGKEFGLKEAGVEADAASAAAKLAQDARADKTKADNDFLLKTGMTRGQFAKLDPAARRKVLSNIKKAGQAKPKGPTASDKKTEADLKYFQEHGYYPPTGPPKDPSSKSEFAPKDIRKARVDVRSAILQAKSAKGGKVARNDALTALTDKYGATLARVAIGAIYDGGAKPHLNTELKQNYGVYIPSEYLYRPRRK